MDNNQDIVVKVEALKKLYRIGVLDEQHSSIADLAMSWVKSPLRNFQKLRNLSSIKNETDDDVLIALQNVSFELRKGEVLGVVGKNGAGKSTLLKLLSRITKPSGGQITINGRVASLLEVGTGFHPELTGRENIYLNGTILGMKKKEIDAKLKEIIDFSGVERFVDTPVKRYSSGMTVRLAFAVAAHLDPEILIIDEVLAVGDVEFQRKCLGKMGEVSKSGKTVLFVSHNMGAVAELCTRAILLEKGQLVLEGTTEEVIQRYLEGENTSEFGVDRSQLGPAGDICYLLDAKMYNDKEEELYQFDINENMHLEFDYHLVNAQNSFDNVVHLRRNGIEVLTTFDTDHVEIEERSAGNYRVKMMIPPMFLKAGNYTATIVYRNTLDGVHHHTYENVVRFEIEALSFSTANKGYHHSRDGLVIFPGKFSMNKLEA